MAQEIKFIRLFNKTIALLEEKKIPYMVVGGLAVNYFGEPRFTKDIDLVVAIDPKKEAAFLQALKKGGFVFFEKEIKMLLKASNIFHVHDTTGVNQIDFWIPKTSFELKAFSRRQAKRWRNKKIYFLSPEDLILFKIIADRPKDIADIKSVFQRQEGKLDREYLRFWSMALNKEKKLKQLEKSL